MVQLSSALCKYIPKWYAINNSSSKQFWKKHNLYKMTQYYYGRSRNCHKLAKKKFFKYTQYEWQERGSEKKLGIRDIYSQRILAACKEHDFPFSHFVSVLPLIGIDLDRYSLSCLAIWEPRTFKSLIHVAKEFCHENQLDPMANFEKPETVISRGNLSNLIVKI